MGALPSQITSLTIVYSTVYSDADQGKHQSSASLAFVRGIHRGPVNSPHKWPVTRKMFPFDYVIMIFCSHGRPICNGYYSIRCAVKQREPRGHIIPNFSSLATLVVVITTTNDATRYEKVGTTTTPVFREVIHNSPPFKTRFVIVPTLTLVALRWS